ncbi:MAG TPA: outer membrane beta-barrel protein, partial [Chitinophagaceae bacterium]|nr:outer membrane beta-barrel protein [Chitinophagaceae bacterium]
MPENEFENKVSSEMQELKFKPSEQVWLRVEERIRKKNKRRVFIIIFLLSGLALLSYWQRSNLFGEKKNDIAKIVHGTSSGEKQKENSSKTSDETNSSSATKQNTETVKQEETNNTPDKTINNKLAHEEPVIDKKNIIVSSNEIYKPKNNKKNETKTKPGSEKTKIEQKPEIDVDVVAANSQRQKSIIDDIKTKDTLNVKAYAETDVKPDEVKQAEVKPVEDKIDSAKAAVIQSEEILVKIKDIATKEIPLRDSAASVVEKNPLGKKWKWGLHFTPGISSLNDQGFSIGTNKSADAFNYQSPVGSGSGASPIRQRPSDVKSGFAFQAGVLAQRQLSSHTGLSLGLQYGYYSNRLRIGNRRDSLNRSNQLSNILDDKANFVYNAGGDTIRYTNRYHFIELPFLFQWQLNKNKAKPFIWNTGFTLGQLIATNAIMYDTAFNGIYYSNKSLQNKTQLSLSTGFSWTLANNKRVQWSL